MFRKASAKAYLYAMTAVIFWATSPTAFKLGLRHQDVYQLLTRASLTSLVVLGAIVLIRRKKSQYNWRGWKDLGFSAIMGAVNPVVYYLVLFRAYELLPAQVAQPLNMVWPIVLVLISIPLLGQKISWKSVGAMFLSFAGVFAISLQGGNAVPGAANRFGIFLALSSSVLWACYFLYNTKDSADPVWRLFLNFLFATVYLLTGSLLLDSGLSGSAWAWGTAIYIGIFEMGVTFVWWLMALQHATTTDRISNLVYVAPFLNLFIVNRILGEEIYVTTMAGMVLLVSGILIQKVIIRHAERG